MNRSHPILRPVRRPSAPVLALLALMLPALALLALAPAPAAAQAEKILDTPAGWTYRYAAGTADIAADIQAGLRPFSIQRVGANTYDVISVANAGPYEVAGFGTANMHYNRTPAQLGVDLANRRLVGLDCYEVSGQTQIAAVSVPNTGGAAAGWGWLVGQSRQQIIDWVANTTPALRILDLSIYTIGGQKYYAAVAVQNQGAQHQGWWWYFDQTPQQIADLLTQNGARLVDIELETPPTLQSAARFACVMVADNPGAGWVHGSLTSAQLDELVGQTGGRLTNLHRYQSFFGTTLYAVSLVDNANDQSRRMRGYMAGQATTGHYGFKLKRVGGEVLASLNDGFVLEPASSMKIVHAAWAIRECSLGHRSLSDLIWADNTCGGDFWNNVCPEDDPTCSSGDEPLSTTISSMMMSSHNGRTRTIEELAGRAALNDFAEFTVGLPDTRINHTLGCLCDNTPNTTTATDLVDIYEQIAGGSLFSATWRDQLHDLMPNVTAWGFGSTSDRAFYTLGQVIDQEAAATALTAGEIADFKAAVRYAVKGGAYGCSGTMWRCSAGWAELPHRISLAGSWFTVRRSYAFATFVDEGSDPGSRVAYPASEEILREQIRDALQSWDDACVPAIAQHPDDVTVDQGQDAQFTAAEAGAGDAAYGWQFLVGGIWFNVPQSAKYAGVATATLTVHDAQPEDATSFRCRISKDCGTVVSDPAVLTVVPDGASAAATTPTRLVVHAPAPNPFNPLVTVRYELPGRTGRVTLDVFDVTGRRVRTLAAASLAAGPHEFTWNGTDDGGRRVSSGVYMLRLRADRQETMHRVTMLE
ncbi:MAG TPA: FlgD immunoglobulin-like domain containing protein [Candidatus Krumholzibacteria bacterium]|nr:FlgD immunoglobulin-like domain containing protein [Candidatus Krumholzibacteria bacterium]